MPTVILIGYVVAICFAYLFVTALAARLCYALIMGGKECSRCNFDEWFLCSSEHVEMSWMFGVFWPITLLAALALFLAQKAFSVFEVFSR